MERQCDIDINTLNNLKKYKKETGKTEVLLKDSDNSDDIVADRNWNIEKSTWKDEIIS